MKNPILGRGWDLCVLCKNVTILNMFYKKMLKNRRNDGAENIDRGGRTWYDKSRRNPIETIKKEVSL